MFRKILLVKPRNLLNKNKIGLLNNISKRNININEQPKIKLDDWDSEAYLKEHFYPKRDYKVPVHSEIDLVYQKLEIFYSQIFQSLKKSSDKQVPIFLKF